LSWRINVEDAALILAAGLFISLFVVTFYSAFLHPEEASICGEIFDIVYWEKDNITAILVKDWGRYFLKGNWTNTLKVGEVYIINFRLYPRAFPYNIWEVTSYYHIKMWEEAEER